MALNDSDIEILKYMKRVARYFAHWCRYEKLPLALELPIETFLDYGSKLMNDLIDRVNTLDVQDYKFDCFLASCEMLRQQGKLNSVIVELYTRHRKSKFTSSEIREAQELLNEA